MLKIADREDLEFYANDLGIEVDADWTDEDLQATCIAALDAIDDAGWDELDETRTQAWSNEINTARLELKKKEAAAKKKAKDKKAPPKKAPAKMAATKEPTKAEVEAAKKKAKAKAAKDAPKKQVISKEPYRDGTTAWHVWDIIFEAGQKGISIKEAVPLFEARVKKHKLTTTNAKSRVNTIMRQCVFKELATRKGDKYFNTAKSTAAMKTAKANKAKADKAKVKK